MRKLLLFVILTGLGTLLLTPTSAPEPVLELETDETTIQPEKPVEQAEIKPEPIPEPVVKPVPVPVKPKPVVSSDCYYSLLSQYEWDVATMQRIMRAESGCRPDNHNYQDGHRTCTGSYGLLQIGCVHGYSATYLSDPANNIAVAYKVWKSQGYRAWTTY